MDRKYMPLILMLAAGAVTCIITFVQNFSALDKLVALFIVLIIFYFLGSVLKATLDYFDKQNKEKEEAEKENEEGEVIEKDTEGEEGKKDK
jgi:divalent metal cation (Fe/Co/Zn/Cd) transporter